MNMKIITYGAHHVKVKRQNGNSPRFIFFKLHEIRRTKKSPTLRAYLLRTYRGNVAKVFIIHLNR